MPELPEVETIRRELAPRLEGRRITGIRLHHDDIILDTPPARFRERLIGARILGVGRRGKWLLFHLDRGVVVSQLRMTGRYAIASGMPPLAVGFQHVAAEFDLDDGQTLFYDDVRRLGGFQLLSRSRWESREARFGPEPLAPHLTAAKLGESLRRGRTPVKTALMDQSRVAGVGNIYASEALHGARIDPARPVSGLSDEELRRLHRALRRTLRTALESAGTTLRDYRAVNGNSGSYQWRLRVYGREGDSCSRCGTTIERIVQAGRSTYYCPGCQS